MNWDTCAYCDREAGAFCEHCERPVCRKHEVIWYGSFSYCRFSYCRNCFVELRKSGVILPDELDDHSERREGE